MSFDDDQIEQKYLVKIKELKNEIASSVQLFCLWEKLTSNKGGKSI